VPTWTGLTGPGVHALLREQMGASESESKGRILVVDDDPDLIDLLGAGLGAHGFDTTLKQSAKDALAELEATEFDAVLTDLSMPGMNGLEFCERVTANRPDVPIVVMTAFASLETAISALQLGAEDYVSKPIRVEALAARLERIVKARSLHAEVKRLREVVERTKCCDEILGSSPAMKEVYDLVGRIVESETTVLITGESGTGKELVAVALHRRGRRKDGPFVAINCSAVPAALLESELFGHAKGAFTDARGERVGLFAKADGGTLFLDEIGDMPPEVQPKLLRALQERKVRPVGSDTEVEVDVRLVAATNRDLDSAVADGRFREDLYFRINVIHVPLPPLRARGRDTLVLAQHFVDRFAAQAEKQVNGIAAPTAEKLLAYSWPGNVRELQNCIERAVALTRFADITVEDLPERIRSYKSSHVIVASDDPGELVTMEAVEKRYIARVMEAVGGNKTLAARTLGFDRKTLYRKLDRYSIEVAPNKE